MSRMFTITYKDQGIVGMQQFSLLRILELVDMSDEDLDQIIELDTRNGTNSYQLEDDPNITITRVE